MPAFAEQSELEEIEQEKACHAPAQRFDREGKEEKREGVLAEVDECREAIVHVDPSGCLFGCVVLPTCQPIMLTSGCSSGGTSRRYAVAPVHRQGPAFTRSGRTRTVGAPEGNSHTNFPSEPFTWEKYLKTSKESWAVLMNSERSQKEWTAKIEHAKAEQLSKTLQSRGWPTGASYESSDESTADMRSRASGQDAPYEPCPVH